MQSQSKRWTVAILAAVVVSAGVAHGQASIVPGIQAAARF